VNFLIDNQLPPALARLIQSELNCSAVHVVDVGMRDASDAEVWTYASETDSILVSKDEDFANMVLQVPTAKLIWIRTGNCRKTFLLDLFRRMWPRILQRLENGDRAIEIR
jgi:predicted nuclease of predicted toxin-antitoxin system